MKNIGFIGLGNMGKGMSINLAKENLNVIGYDINTSCYESLKNQNIKTVDSLKPLVENSDIIITMLPDGNIVENVWTEIFEYSKPNQFLIDCSTIDVKTSILVQNKASQKSLHTLDAPVSGGVIGADQGTLTFMVGGNFETYNDVKFLFEIMGKNSILCGKVGAGQSAKICNNMLLATTMIAVGETFELGKNLGLNLKKLYEVLSTSTGSCWAINSYCPIEGVGPISPSDNGYSGGFSTALMYKDLGLAMDAIQETKSRVDYGKETFKKYEKCVQNGKGHLDFSNIINE